MSAIRHLNWYEVDNNFTGKVNFLPFFACVYVYTVKAFMEIIMERVGAFFKGKIQFNE